MRREEDVRTALRAWLAATCAERLPAGFDDRTPLVSTGILDSVRVLDLLLLVEELRGRAVEVETLEAGAFRDVDTIWRRFFAGTEDGHGR